MTTKSRKQAIIVDENLTWRYAASYILESANFAVTAIKRHDLKDHLNNNNKKLDLVVIHVSPASSLCELRDILYTCRLHNIDTILSVSSIRLSSLHYLQQLQPSALIPSNAIKQLIYALTDLGKQSSYCAPILKASIKQYIYCLSQTPATLKTEIKNTLLFYTGRIEQIPATLH